MKAGQGGADGSDRQQDSLGFWILPVVEKRKRRVGQKGKEEGGGRERQRQRSEKRYEKKNPPSRIWENG